jgi:Domain of unknown function (DUF4389)
MTAANGYAAMEQAAAHPILLRIDDDLRRPRLLVFFRILLALPHLLWLLLWGIVAFVVAIVNWLVTLVRGRSPRALHRFLAAYVRYIVHVQSFVYLAGNPFPGFTGAAGRYPIDVEIAPPERQRRWTVLLRLLLAVPALLIGGALAAFPSGAGSGSAGVAATVAFLAWFAALVRGRMPRGFRDVVAYAMQYAAQLAGYLFLLTDRYPSSDPLLVALPELEVDHPVRLSHERELGRPRLTVFFRILLVLPHIVWLVLWTTVVAILAIPAWIAAVVRARLPRPFARFFAANIRYAAHVAAYLTLVGRPFPGFLGREGTYPVDVHLEPAQRQNRWKLAFRLLLAVPAFIASGAVDNILLVVAFLGWFVSLVLGRIPGGLVNAGAFAIRYRTQVYAYALLLTGAYPHSSPALERAASPDA